MRAYCKTKQVSVDMGIIRSLQGDKCISGISLDAYQYEREHSSVVELQPSLYFSGTRILILWQLMGCHDSLWV